jgi:hypothetical protein
MLGLLIVKVKKVETDCTRPGGGGQKAMKRGYPPTTNVMVMMVKYMFKYTCYHSQFQARWGVYSITVGSLGNQ